MHVVDFITLSKWQVAIQHLTTFLFVWAELSLLESNESETQQTKPRGKIAAYFFGAEKRHFQNISATR